MSLNSPKSTTPQQKMAQMLTKLDNLTIEVAAAEKTLAQTKAEQTLQTQKLLDQRQNELKKLELEHNKQLKPLISTIDELKSQVKALNTQKISLEGDLVALDSQINEAKAELKDITDQIQTETNKLEPLNRKITGAQKAISDLAEQKSLTEQFNADLISKGAELEAAFNDLEVNYERMSLKFEEDQKKAKNKLDNLAFDIKNAEDVLDDLETQAKAIRQDLADRTRRLEDRENNVKRREYKLNRDEDIIKRNATLLDL